MMKGYEGGGTEGEMKGGGKERDIEEGREGGKWGEVESDRGEKGVLRC